MVFLTNLIIGLVLGYLVAMSSFTPHHTTPDTPQTQVVSSNIPVPPQNSIGPHEEIVKPIQVDPRELEYIKDCTGFGFSKDQCVSIWNNKQTQ